MTGDAGPADLPGQSRIPFSCCLEEHVRYSNPRSCLSGDEWDDPCHVPVFPATNWTRKEVGARSYGQRARRADPVHRLKGGIELFDRRSSTKVFYKTFNRECPGEEPENVQTD